MVITQDIENRFNINRSIDEKGVRLTSAPLLEPVQTRGLHNGFEAVNGSKTAVINQPQNNHTTTNITYLYMFFLNIDSNKRFQNKQLHYLNSLHFINRRSF